MQRNHLAIAIIPSDIRDMRLRKKKKKKEKLNYKLSTVPPKKREAALVQKKRMIPKRIECDN